MKKSFLFMSLLLGLFVSVFALTACSSDDDDNDASSIEIGSVWSYTAPDGLYCELTVKSNTVAHIIIKSSSGKIIEDADYSYIYDEATHTGKATYVSGQTTVSDPSSFVVDFTINGNKMDTTFDGKPITLTRQK